MLQSLLTHCVVIIRSRGWFYIQPRHIYVDQVNQSPFMLNPPPLYEWSENTWLWMITNGLYKCIFSPRSWVKKKHEVSAWNDERSRIPRNFIREAPLNDALAERWATSDVKLISRPTDRPMKWFEVHIVAAESLEQVDWKTPNPVSDRHPIFGGAPDPIANHFVAAYRRNSCYRRACSLLSCHVTPAVTTYEAAARAAKSNRRAILCFLVTTQKRTPEDNDP